MSRNALPLSSNPDLTRVGTSECARPAPHGCVPTAREMRRQRRPQTAREWAQPPFLLIAPLVLYHPLRVHLGSVRPEYRDCDPNIANGSRACGTPSSRRSARSSSGSLDDAAQAEFESTYREIGAGKTNRCPRSGAHYSRSERKDHYESDPTNIEKAKEQQQIFHRNDMPFF